MKVKNPEEIHNWLNGQRDYQEGVRIYQNVGPHVHLARLLVRRNMPDKLLHEMKKLAVKYPAAKPVTKRTAQPPQVPSPPIQTGVIVKDVKQADTDLLAQIKERNSMLMDERRALFFHGLLDSLTKEERMHNAWRIEDIGEELDHNFEKLRIFNETGAFPVPHIKSGLSDLSIVQLLKRKETVRSYLSRYKGKPNKLKKLEQYSAEMAELEKLIEAKS